MLKIVAVLAVMPFCHHDYQRLKTVKETIDVDGRMDREYMKSKKRTSSDVFQRKYAVNGGYQGCSSNIRNFCADGNYHDLDIVNCFPTLLS